MNTHFGLTAQSRKTGMNVIMNRLPKYNTENLPVVFMGDCNTLSTDSVFDEFRKTLHGEDGRYIDTEPQEKLQLLYG